MSHVPPVDIICVLPRDERRLNHGFTIRNDSDTKPLYVRVGLESVKVSHRRPAPYGLKK